MELYQSTNFAIGGEITAKRYLRKQLKRLCLKELCIETLVMCSCSNLLFYHIQKTKFRSGFEFNSSIFVSFYNIV